MKKMLLFLFVAILATSVVAEIPKVISYQGRLTNEVTGEPVIDTCDFTFSLYNLETGGTALWSETQVVSTDSAGLYCVKLGSTTPFPASLDFTEPYWLGILIDGTVELSPRYQLTSSPYAFHSITADFADTSQFADMSLYSEHALEADSADYADNAEYAIVSDTAYSVDWTNITTMPAGFADGIDNEGTGTIYYAGDGIDISSDTISIPEDGIEAFMLSNMGATDGQVMKWNSGTGGWEPQNDIGGGAGDGWGSQVVQSDATLDGSGTTTSTLKIAQQGATTGQILKWDGSTWSPADDSVGTGGSGGISGSGTINYVPKFTNLAGDQIGDSHISDNVSVDINTSVNISHTGQVGLQCDGTDGSWASIYVNAQTATADPGYGYLREGFIFGHTYLNSDFTWILQNGGWASMTNNFAIDSTGNVGIGTIYPSFKLDVAGTLSTEGFQMSDGASSGYVLTSDGSGYGTWQPGGGGGTVSTTARLSGDGSVGDPLDIAQHGATDGQVLKWSAASSAWEPDNDIGGGSGDNWGSQVVQSDATLSGDGTTGNELQIAQQGATDGQVLKWSAVGSIWEPGNDETGSGADSDWTISGSDMYSAVSGNVGIGTTTPTAKLDISTNSDAFAPTIALRETEDDWARIHFYDTATPNFFGIAGWPSASDNFARLDIFYSGSGGNIATFHGDGNVGIGLGTAIPEHKLHVITDGEIAAGYFVNQSPSLDYFGVYGACANNDYYGYGGYFKGGYIGAYGFVEPTGNLYYMGVSGYVTGGSGDNYGVKGSSYGGETNYGVYGIASGGTTNYGVYGETSGGTTNWAGYFSGDAHFTGCVSIGDSSTYSGLNLLRIAGDVRIESHFPSITLSGIETDGRSWSISESAGNLKIHYWAGSWFSYITVKPDGKLGIGTSAPTRLLWVDGDAGGTGAWHNDSDERLKQNIVTIPNALDKVKQLRGVQFEWKETENHAEGEQIGFIAQEVLPILPEVVDKPGEYYGMQYAPITALLVEAMKEQQIIIEQLKAEIELLKAQNNSL